MAKRSVRSQTPTTRSRTIGDEPVETANDAAAQLASGSEATPSEDDIRHRAYQRYLQRGGGHGLDFEDWVEAERELRSQNSKLKT